MDFVVVSDKKGEIPFLNVYVLAMKFQMHAPKDFLKNLFHQKSGVEATDEVSYLKNFSVMKR